MHYILSIDQGTSSSRVIVFDTQGHVIGQHQLTLQQYYPDEAWVEHDAEEIWQATLTCAREAIKAAAVNVGDIKALGISNQRETTVVWNKQTGKPIHRAIVWQDRRSAAYCETLKKDPSLEQRIQHKTGLLIDPYFSATKITWLLDNVDGAREQAQQGLLAFGTIDTFLLWRLTGGKSHYTDATNASRTMLYNIRIGQWDAQLLELFDIPPSMLPEVKDSADDFGCTEEALLGASVPVTGVAGDQQAACFGQACFQPGMVKSTYGTGCFVLVNTGETVVQSKNRLLSTIAYQLQGKPTYGLEGSIFVAGAAVLWLRDALNMFEQTTQIQALIDHTSDTAGVYLVPAFTGLGAPYWDPNARGALLGLTRDTGVAHIVRAALEAVCYQTRDLLQAMSADFGQSIDVLRVDGGMVSNDWLLQFLADILPAQVDRAVCIESSALGAAMLAALGAGLFTSLEQVQACWARDQVFEPAMPAQQRDQLYSGWQAAVSRITSR